MHLDIQKMQSPQFGTGRVNSFIYVVKHTYLRIHFVKCHPWLSISCPMILISNRSPFIFYFLFVESGNFTVFRADNFILRDNRAPAIARFISYFFFFFCFSRSLQQFLEMCTFRCLFPEGLLTEILQNVKSVVDYIGNWLSHLKLLLA